MDVVCSEPAPGLPESTVTRLPGYLRALQALHETGTVTTSSGELAQLAGVQPALLRRDLSYLGSFGTRGVGYVVETLIDAIGRVVGSRDDWPVVILGVGSLGRALARHHGLGRRGFNVVALVDVDPRIIGTRVAGVTVCALDELADVVRRARPVIGILTTPPEVAQDCADRLVAAGVRRILTFAAAPLEVPPEVTVRQVDLAREMQVLVYHELARPDAATPA